ncbi:MAG: Spy/CpxP family protein refolding chaperone [Pelomonas sp.]|nr:Spy/CpxP family protein refolding chaperone [Roseateles sp.]
MFKTRLQRLAAVAVFALGAVVAQAQPPMHGPRGDEHDGPRMKFEHEHIERMLDVADASDAQRQQIHAILMAEHKDLMAQHEEGRQLHEQGEALFAAPTVDAQAAEALRAKGEALHDAASKRMLKARLDIANVLTPEQRTRIAHMMARQHERMEAHMKAMAEHRPPHPASAPQ